MKYAANKVHRNKTAGKTQWHSSLTPQIEEHIWNVGIGQKWTTGRDCYSLHIQNGIAHSVDDNGVLKLSKFISDNNNIWHGWPGNPQRSQMDLPPYEILKQWVGNGYATRAKIAKLRRFQACSI